MFINHASSFLLFYFARTRVKCQKDGQNKENQTIYKSWLKRAKYKEPKSSYFWKHIWTTLFFLDLPKQFANAQNSDFGTIGSRLGNKLFYLIFGVLSWMNTVIHILFPPVFAALLVVAPICY